MSDDVVTMLHDVHSVLTEHGEGWTLIGGLAANTYRHTVRATNDADVLISFGHADTEESLRRVATQLEQLGWTVSDDRNREWMVRMFHPQHGAVDIIAAQLDYQKEIIARSAYHAVDHEWGIRTASVEDVLILKLIADRSQDAADVESILVTNPDLDMDYLRYWMKEWAVEDRYERSASTVRDRERLRAAS